jgi:hypothetical protein
MAQPPPVSGHLDALGWHIIVITADDFHNAPEQVLARVRAVLIERGAPVSGGNSRRSGFATSLRSSRFDGCDEKRAGRTRVSGPS